MHNVVALTTLSHRFHTHLHRHTHTNTHTHAHTHALYGFKWRGVTSGVPAAVSPARSAILGHRVGLPARQTGPLLCVFSGLAPVFQLHSGLDTIFGLTYIGAIESKPGLPLLAKAFALVVPRAALFPQNWTQYALLVCDSPPPSFPFLP